MFPDIMSSRFKSTLLKLMRIIFAVHSVHYEPCRQKQKRRMVSISKGMVDFAPVCGYI